MAELQATTSGKARRKICTPRIDLTPMVDLGFLLITFFMYTTTLARPMVMELQMPYLPSTPVSPPVIPAEATIILMPAAGHRVAYYRGAQHAESLHWCGFTGFNNIRDLLEQEQRRVQSLPATFSREAHKLHVLIKADTSAAYDDIVHTLDELAITTVPYYTMMRIAPDEQAAVKKISAAGYGK